MVVMINLNKIQLISNPKQQNKQTQHRLI